MNINLPDIPAIYNIYKLSSDDHKRDTVESVEWFKNSFPELDGMIRHYRAARAVIDNELSRAEIAIEYMDKFESQRRISHIMSCQK